MKIKSYKMTFDGEILKRGFWLYIWEIREGSSTYIYVGRTGDSSSPNASSPFNRIGQHLDFRDNAKSNSLAKRLKEVELNPKSCKFRMLALGPLYPEVKDFEDHKLFRDYMATYEYELSSYLKTHGYDVLGTHKKGSEIQEKQLREITQEAKSFLESMA